MKVSQIVKFMYPVFGGMERVAEIISIALREKRILEYKVFFLRDKKHLNLIEKDERTALIDPLFYFRSQPVSFLQAPLSIWKKFRDTDITIIHSPFPNLEIPLYLFSFLIKRKIICIMHADPKDTRWKSFKGILNFFYNRFFKRCEVVVFTNNLNAKLSVIPCKNKIVINNGVKIELSAPKKFLRKDTYEILYVGSFREYKGLRYLIDSLDYIDNGRLHLVGNGELFDKLKEYALGKFDRSRVIFYGNMSDQELNDIYYTSDVFVLPSINGSEAFGLVQVEAMAKGLPVVNTDLETAVKLVSLHKETGITVKPADSQAIALALKTILQPGTYDRMSANAIERAKLYSADKMAEQYINLITHLSGEISDVKA